MRGKLVGVCVVSAMLSVEDARAQIRGVNPRNIAQALGDWVVGIFDCGLVLVRDGLQDIRAGQHILTGPGQVFHNGTCANGLAVHLLEDVERLVALVSISMPVISP